ncbi:carbohydrate ABC transporter permease [Labrys wisconsinensis]|uniref:ABC-type glycerol-3-phosphate transport system permease component n=1 Tax=Labrys wisconsinensis TaxID=425677 RepID=A0ABU0JIT2_9HYPH|nr:carbohydrate ABC transporter permease [Labrys wisconsinensis]MDQ0473401.1 ABC-type glycerol-3-phosphate transport system permease component [Labrys wisconsinensis]
MTETAVRQRPTPGPHAMAVLLCILAGFPFVWMLATAFDPGMSRDQGAGPFANFVRAFELAPVARWLAESFLIAIAIAGLKLLVSAPAAYAFALVEFRGRSPLFALVIGSMVVPDAVTLIPNFILVSNLGWVDTPQGVVVPMVAFTGLHVFLLRQAMTQIPREILDASRIDGASRWGIFWHIVLPIVRPTLIVVAILAFLGAWNLYLWPALVLSADTVKTLPVGLQSFAAGQGQSNEWGALMAVGVLAVAPPLAILVLAQRSLISVLGGRG